MTAPGQQPQWGSYRHRYSAPPPQLPAAAAVKPGIVALAPLNLGSVLGGAFTVYKFNPAAMIALPLVLFGALAAIGAPLAFLLSSGLETVSDPFQIGVQVLPAVLGIAALALVSCAIIPFVAGSVHGAVLGRKLTVAEIWTATSRRIPAVLGYTLLLGLAMVVTTVLLILPMVALQENVPALVGAMILLSLAYTVFWVWLSVKVLVAPAAIAVEGLGPIAAIRRSFRLTRGAFWPVLGTYLLASMIASIAQQLLGGLVSVPIAMVTSLVDLERPDLLLATLMVPAAFLSMAIVLPFNYAVVTLIYVDRRIKLEAYDVELAQQAAPVQPPSAWGRS